MNLAKKHFAGDKKNDDHTESGKCRDFGHLINQTLIWIAIIFLSFAVAKTLF